MVKISSTKDLLMLLLFARGAKEIEREPIRGKTRLMKMVFLFGKELKRSFNFGKEISSEALPDFTPYDFGPFSAKVYRDLEFLVESGFVAVREIDSPIIEEQRGENEDWDTALVQDNDRPSLYEEEFLLTSLGAEFVSSGALGKCSLEQERALDEFKSRCSSITLRTLLRYVYTRYPETTTESRIRDDILSNKTSY